MLLAWEVEQPRTESRPHHVADPRRWLMLVTMRSYRPAGGVRDGTASSSRWWAVRPWLPRSCRPCTRERAFSRSRRRSAATSWKGAAAISCVSTETFQWAHRAPHRDLGWLTGLVYTGNFAGLTRGTTAPFAQRIRVSSPSVGAPVAMPTGRGAALLESMRAIGCARRPRSASRRPTPRYPAREELHER